MISRLTRYYCFDFFPLIFVSTSFLVNIGKEMSLRGFVIITEIIERKQNFAILMANRDRYSRPD